MLARVVTGGFNKLRRNKLVSSIYHEARLRLANKGNQEPILIYQMGKVGSSSILDSLRAAKLDRPIFHIHFLNPQNIQRAEDILLRSFGRHGSVNRWGIYESRFVTRHFLHRQNARLKIISLVREPVARNVSSFFANVDMFVPDCAVRYEAGEIGIAELTQHYLRDFHEHNHPLDWFDDEMKAVFGIDVFSSEDLEYRDHGTFVYKRGEVQLLVLRLEDMDTVAPLALQRYLAVDGIALTKANQAHDKDYDRAYRDFRKKLELPADYLAKMYESKFANFFYSGPELERFRSYWSSHR
jgi:hypothetical protein